MSEDGAVDGEIKIGDVAHDLAQNGSKVQVVGRAADTVAEHEGGESYDVSTYKANALLNVADDEPVWRCVYLSSELTTSFSNTYDIPDSRLARIPVEEANEDLRRFQRELTVNAAAAVASAVDPDEGYGTGTLRGILTKAFGEEIADEALELAQVDAVIGGGDGGD